MALQSQLFRGDLKLEAAAVSDPAHILQGASGEHVLKIQQALIQVDGAAIKPDGKYGPATARAVSAFKQKRNILNFQGKIDDIVGKKTIAALDREMLRREKGGGATKGSRLGIVGDVGAEMIIHTLIYFSGAGDGTLDGVPLLGGNRQDVQIGMESIGVQPDGKNVFGFGGSNKTNAGVLAAHLVVAARDPAGKLIIYGFSAGGINALQLCRGLAILGVNIDLLVTVDVSDGSVGSSTVDPVVPDNVLVNRNYFQRTFFDFGPLGVRTVGRKVVPIDCTNRTFSKIPIILGGKSNHGQMETITHSDTIRDMRIVLTGK